MISVHEQANPIQGEIYLNNYKNCKKVINCETLPVRSTIFGSNKKYLTSKLVLITIKMPPKLRIAKMPRCEYLVRIHPEIFTMSPNEY